MGEDAEGRNLFFRQVDSEVKKDEIKLSDRIGSGVGLLLFLVCIAFFLIHLRRPTGFFTDEFGSLATFLFFAPPVLGMVHLGGRIIVGRQNVLRPLESGNNIFAFISAVYLFTLFPFDFSHFAEPFPRFLEFTISWISDGIAKFIMVVMIISFGALSIYTPLLYIHVKRALNRPSSGI